MRFCHLTQIISQIYFQQSVDLTIPCIPASSALLKKRKTDLCKVFISNCICSYIAQTSNWKSLRTGGSTKTTTLVSMETPSVQYCINLFMSKLLSVSLIPDCFSQSNLVHQSLKSTACRMFLFRCILRLLLSFPLLGNTTATAQTSRTLV
jgi:hypothetical protein